MADHAIYMTDWGEVRLSPSEAEQLQCWQRIACSGFDRPVVDAIRAKLDAKLDDIERVAKFKNGYC